MGPVGAAPGVAPERLLQAGTPEGLPGYSLQPDGRLLIESDAKRRIFQCVETQLGARFIWHSLPTKRLLQWLMEGRLDIAFPMGFTAERASMLRQSAPAWENPDVWLSLRPLRADDKQLRLAARLGSPQQAELAAEGYARMVGYYSYEELARALAQNRTDAVVVPQSVYQDQLGLWPSGLLVTPGRARSSGFYLPPSDPKGLAAALDRAIERCRAPQRSAAAFSPSQASTASGAVSARRIRGPKPTA